MQAGNPALPGRRCLAGLCLLYAAMMLYASTIIGPSGINFVYRNPATVFQAFLQTPYIDHGSDQRADWIGNLLMLVPFGFLVTGAASPRHTAFRLPNALAAISICAVTVLAIKYLQLFFPPRTVTLNYILAQSLGALIGCAGWAIWQGRLAPSASRHDPLGTVVLALRLYCVALFLFVLMPLDFALDLADLQTQYARLPNTLLALPGPDRPLAVRAMMIGAAAAAFIPVGMLLTVVRRNVCQIRHGLAAIAVSGLAITTGLYGITTLVIGAYPVLPSILYRTGGIMVGAMAVRWLMRQDVACLRRGLQRLVPWAVLPYLLSVLLVNRLLSTHWLSVSQAIAQAYPLGFLPLFDYYIVSKADAAKNIIGHVVLYLPIGVLAWLHNDRFRPAPVFSAAAALSFLVELGRCFRPGLEGDINAVFVAGFAAMLTAQSMPTLWSMLQALQPQTQAASRR